MMNTSLVLIKPEACREKFLDAAYDHFHRHGARVDDMMVLSGLQVKRGAYVERHYSSVNALAACPLEDLTAFMSDEAAALFLGAFGEVWDTVMEERRVLTPEDAMNVFGFTPQELDAHWWASDSRVRLEYGLYVSFLREERMYVLNGFYPRLLESFTAPGSQICFFIVSWPESKYTWTSFRLEVLGAADPGEAEPTSLRRLLYDNWESYGLSERPSLRSNGLDAASGPLEALAHRLLWMHRRPSEDDFGRALLREGVAPEFLEQLVKNPTMTYNGTRQPVFELLENMQSSEVLHHIAVLFAMEKQKRAKQSVDNVGESRTMSVVADWTIVLDDEDADERRNRALVFVKPHANTPETRALVTERLMQVKGMQLVGQRQVLGSEIASRRVVDKHYRTISRYAVDILPTSITLGAQSRAKFSETFGVTWEEALLCGRVWNAETALHALGEISSDELYDMWGSCTKTVKLAPGAYVAHFCNENVFVINGFYPYLRDAYCAENAKVMCYLISWPEANLTWRVFREEIVGSTNPGNAHPNSLRGLIRDRWQGLGLPYPPTTTDNAVHASAGPFEAVLERHLWTCSPLSYDPFTLRLQEYGLTGALLYRWGSNPEVVLPDNKLSGCVFDLLENMQTSEMVDVMREAEQQALTVHTEVPMNRAVVILRPFATNDRTIERVRKVLKDADVKVKEETLFFSDHIVKCYLEGASFSAISRLADATSEGLRDDVSLSIKNAFEEHFGFSWNFSVDTGKLMGATNACEELRLTPTELLQLWDASTPKKIGPACYVATLSSFDVSVINGFVPFVRETHGRPGSRVCVFNVEWKESSRTWRDFCEVLIGDPADPRVAAQGSLQRLFAEEWSDYELPLQPVSRTTAALYASEGPLEAAADREAWLGVELSEDPFVQHLLLEAVPLALLLPYVRNERHDGPEQLSHQPEKQQSFFSSAPLGHTREMLSRHQQSSEVVRRLKVLTSRSARALKMNYAFLWVKPHAGTPEVLEWIPSVLNEHRIEVLSSGHLMMDTVIEKQLVDQQYKALYRNAIGRKVSDLPITTKQMMDFERSFNISWSTAVNLHMIINAAEAVERMGVIQLLESWDAATRKVCLSPDLYVAYLEEEGLYVVNGFYPYFRSRLYTGSRIHWFTVMWDGEIMTWSEFQTFVIGTELPVSAEAGSLRRRLSTSWVELGLQQRPDGIDNGFHASASPIEGLTDRVSWLSLSVEEDVFGQLLIESGVSAEYLRTLVRNPLVRHRDESIETVSDVFEKLCTETPLLLAQLIGLQMSGGMHIVSEGFKSVLSFFQSPSSQEGAAKTSDGNSNNSGEGDSEAKVSMECNVTGCATNTITSAMTPSTNPGVMKRNYAFLLVNPSCVTSESEELTTAFITDFLLRHKIRIEVEGSLKCIPVVLRHMVDDLQWDVFNYAVKQVPCEYALDADALSAFSTAFGESWDPKKILNAVEVSARFNFSAMRLQEVWDSCRLRKRIAPSLYIGKMPDYDLYIVNGFALRSAEVFNLSSSLKKYFFVSWDNADGDYAHYLRHVIGDSCVEEAEPCSLHGVLLSEWKHAGFHCPPDPFEGFVLTSTSALDAIRQRQLWLSLGLLRDPVGRFAIKNLGVSPYCVRWAASNPRAMPSDDCCLFDRMRGQGSAEALRFLVAENKRCQDSPVRNSAFLLIKNHALCRPFAMTIKMVFSGADVRIDEEGDLSGTVVRARGLVHYLYPTASKYAMRDVSTICLSKEERDIVRRDLGISWEQLLRDKLIVNACHALKVLGDVTPQHLYERWSAARRKVILRRDLTIAELEGSGIFVVNGFFPELRQSFESGTALLHWYVVSWSEECMKWSDFLEKVIGDECPRVACPGSIRGHLFRRWREYGLCMVPDQIHNGLHVSQSALQAIQERTKCLSYALSEDYLGDVILRRGVPERIVRVWLDNPDVTLGGVWASVFEHLRHCDASRLLVLLTALTEELRREEEDDSRTATDAKRIPVVDSGLRPIVLEGVSQSQEEGAKAHDKAGEGNDVAAQKRCLSEREDALLFRNTAVVVVKPHVSNNLQVLALLEGVFAANKFRVKQELRKSSFSRLVEKHFSSAIYYATHNHFESHLEVTKEGRVAFYEAFGEEWDSVVFSQRVVGAFEALTHFSMTPSQLYVKWSLPEQEHVQLTYDMEVMKFHAEGVYVVNAFLPFELQCMSQADQEEQDTHCYIVSWDQRDCSWRRFLCEVIGDVNPAVAVKTSLRGQLYDEWENFGLLSRPNRVDNILLASGGPLQAFKERELWCGTSNMVPDPLVRALCFLDLDPSQVLEWKENPLVRHVSRTSDEDSVAVRMFAVTHEMDTREFLDLMGEHEGFFVPIVVPCETEHAQGHVDGSPGGTHERSAGAASDDAPFAVGFDVCGAETPEWVQRTLLDAGEEDIVRLWKYYGGATESGGENGAATDGVPSPDTHLPGKLKGSINGRMFKRDIEALDCFGLPLNESKVKKLFGGMAHRGDGRTTYEEFRMVIAVLKQM